MPNDEIDEFLTFYPPRIARQAQSLRKLMLKAVPDAGVQNDRTPEQLSEIVGEG